MTTAHADLLIEPATLLPHDRVLVQGRDRISPAYAAGRELEQAAGAADRRMHVTALRSYF
jgi:hypothetical protein